MGQIRVTFMGVCTIFRDLPQQLPAGMKLPPDTQLPANRVMLVRTPPDFPDKQHPIPRHVARLQIIADKVTMHGPPLPRAKSPRDNVYHLDGVGLSIANGIQHELSATPSCLPSLKARLKVPLGKPAKFVFVPDSKKAQAWVDVPGGSWKGFILKPLPMCTPVPSISILTLETEGPPMLVYTPWSGTAPTVVTLEGKAHILVSNFADGTAVKKDNRDFYLNYLTSAKFSPANFPPPGDIEIPAENECLQQAPGTLRLHGCGDAGPGCSNTGFP